MEGLNDFDVIVFGAGPAGCCAAIRLSQMGHKVAIVEKRQIPRAQIGEALSPGIYNIFDYLGAGHLLENPCYLKNLPSKVLWDSSEAIESHRAEHIVVDRSTLDAELLSFAESKNIVVYRQSLQKSRLWNGRHWDIIIQQGSEKQNLKATYLLEATGRDGAIKNDKMFYAPSNLALWIELDQQDIMAETLVEACSDGWLWGSPVTGGKFRLMVFTDPDQLKSYTVERLFINMITGSTLFKNLASRIVDCSFKACISDHYLHAVPWENQVVRIGEAACSIDPISSSGVEKAMRISLKAAICINTALKGNPDLAQSYFQDVLIDAVVTTQGWTENFYRTMAHITQKDFWKLRGQKSFSFSVKNDFGRRFLDSLNAKTIGESNEGVKNFLISDIWQKCMRVNPNLSYRMVPCVVGDVVLLKEAIIHPEMKREVMFIGGIEIPRLINAMPQRFVFYTLVEYWAAIMSAEQAARTAGEMYRLGIFVQDNNETDKPNSYDTKNGGWIEIQAGSEVWH